MPAEAGRQARRRAGGGWTAIGSGRQHRLPGSRGGYPLLEASLQIAHLERLVSNLAGGV